MNQSRILIILCLLAFVAGCQSLPSQLRESDISITLHPITYSPFISSLTDTWLITDVSQRDPVPDDVFISPREVVLPADLSPALKKWKKDYAAQVDLIVVVKNISANKLFLYEEWNSWGYCNLKFVFESGFHEYWVTKKPGLWYRNFPSWHTLSPGESFQIPVAFADHIWANLNSVRRDASRISLIRAVYEQSNIRLCQSSQYYSAAYLLPRFGFRKKEVHQKPEGEVEPTPAPVDVSDEGIEIEIE